MSHSNTEQPKNSITLMNGAVLECFPKESHQDDFVPDKMKLDATGTYLSIGNKPCKPLPRTTEDVEQQKKLFTDNAFYLLAHSERIMHISRPSTNHVKKRQLLLFSSLCFKSIARTYATRLMSSKNQWQKTLSSMRRRWSRKVV